MKSCHLSLTQLISCLAVLLLAQSIAGQAIHCGNGNDFAGGPIIPDENERWEIFCNEAPEDHNISPPLSDRKNVLNTLINGYTTLGTSSVSSYADNLISYSWSDGTPTVSTPGTTTGVFVNNAPGNGFEITVPADTNLKTLKIYVGVWWAQGRLEASFTDGSAPAYVDTTIGATPGRSNGVYTIQFRSAVPGQTLRIRYTIQTNHFTPHGNVTLESMALQ